MSPSPSPALSPRARTAPRALVILGHPVNHSLSPVFQNAALQAAGIAVHYDRRDVPPAMLAEVLAECAATETAGNVTMPHKEAVFARCDRTSEAARRTGAVNTFWWEDGDLVGHNTDVDGVTATLAALCPRGCHGHIVLLGAGGSAAAVLAACDTMPEMQHAHVYVVARSRDRAAALVRQVGSRATVVGSVDDIPWQDVAVVVNATPLGMRDDDPLPVPLDLLAGGTAVFDLVYRREGTPWVQAARARGHAAEDGLRMLVEQGAAAFTCWFGVAPSRAVMWAALGVPMPAAGETRR